MSVLSIPRLPQLQYELSIWDVARIHGGIRWGVCRKENGLPSRPKHSFSGHAEIGGYTLSRGFRRGCVVSWKWNTYCNVFCIPCSRRRQLLVHFLWRRKQFIISDVSFLLPPPLNAAHRIFLIPSHLFFFRIINTNIMIKKVRTQFDGSFFGQSQNESRVQWRQWQKDATLMK